MRRLAVLSLHTSPLAQPGTGDGGGMNVYVRELTIQRDDDPRYIIRAVERRILRADQEDIAQPPRSEVGEVTAPF